MKKTITLSLALMLTFAIMAQVSPKANKSLSQQKLVQLHANKHDAKGWFGTAQTTLKSVTSDKHVLDSALWWELNTDNNQYELDWKDVFVYNENGQVILFKYYTGNANLHLFAYDSIYYNANSQISERVSYYDETESGQTPVKYGRALYTYNENNLVIQESYFNWDSVSNLWVESWRAEFEYNANGQIETELEYEYNEEAGELQLYMQIKETYNAQSLLSQSIRSYWNADQSSWENAEKSTCEYNASNKLILEQEFYWDSENSLWLNSFKEEYSYDGNGHMTQEIDYDWVEESSAFVPSYKDVY